MKFIVAVAFMVASIRSNQLPNIVDEIESQNIEMMWDGPYGDPSCPPVCLEEDDCSERCKKYSGFV
jgi:hypothetical protein